MTSERENLKRALQLYVSDTYDDISTIRVFSNSCDQWIQDREEEVQALTELTETEESEKELGAVLEKTLSGLKNLQRPLEAMERLTVTSVSVFQKNLNPEMDLETVRLLIRTATFLSSSLLLFKLNNHYFFHPNALNKDVFQNRLQLYILTITSMFDGWKSAALNHFSQVQPKIDQRDLSEEDIKKMLSQIHTLSALRTDQAFAMVLLFKGRSQHFTEKFCELKPQIEQLLGELEGCALQLDSMYKGARISGVVGSAVGIGAAILSAIGLVLIPIPPLSLLFEVAGLGVGLVSGVQGIVTTRVEHRVNNTQSGRAKEAFKRCVTLMNKLQVFFKDVIQQHFEGLKEDVLNEVMVATFEGAVFADDLTGLGSITYEKLINKRLSAEAMYHVTEGEVAINRVAISGLRVVKVVRIGSCVLNSVFAGVDAYFLYKDAHALAQGTETELSQWIRAHTALWRADIESWQKVHDSLREGEKEFEKNEEMLKKSFYPQI